MNNRIDWRDLEPRCSGRWFELLESFGIETRKLNRNGPCPNCGGTDRAHFFEREGRILLYCRHGCGNAGDGNCVSTPEHLLQQQNRWSFPDMVNAIADYLGATPVQPVVHSSRAAAQQMQYPSSHRADPAKAADDLERAETVATHPLFSRENIMPSHLLRTIGKCLALPMISNTGELVNVAAIAPDYRVFWSAGGPSFGAWAVIPAKSDGPRILCLDLFDGWRLWWSLNGAAEIRCTISPEVFLWMTRKMRTAFDAVAVLEDDVEEYRELGLEVVVIPEP